MYDSGLSRWCWIDTVRYGNAPSCDSIVLLYIFEYVLKEV